MLTIIVRALQSAIAVVAGIATAWWLGDGNVAKLVAVLVAAVAAIMIEYALTVAPKRFRRIRRYLDPRSVFEGAWIQNVKKVVAEGVGPQANRFAVFTVTYSDGKYAVEGTAYDPAGKEHSRWKSSEQVHFSGDGRSMTYLWRGTVMGQDDTGNDMDRTGFAALQLSSDDSGTGRVDHVSMQVTLIFNIRRVTPEVIERWKAGANPALLRNLEDRDEFAADYARRLAAGAA